jgi:hypothetical protein
MLQSAAAKKAGKIKTDVKVESRKEEVENGKCRPDAQIEILKQRDDCAEG